MHIKIPSDLNRIKNKVAIGLSARQLICIGAGLAVAIPITLIARAAMELELNTSLTILMVTLAPFSMFAFFEKDGLFLEHFLRYRLRKMFFYPRRRLYKQKNRYNYMIFLSASNQANGKVGESQQPTA